MSNIQVAILNVSTVLDDAAVAAAVPDLQTQVTRDFAPVWGIGADLAFIPHGKKPPASSWLLTILDDSDQAGDLGYHDLTKAGLPLGKVFAGSDLKNKQSWTVTASHELLEMLGDPDMNLTAFAQTSDSHGRLYAYEVCDACEDDRFGYKIGKTLVSNFVYPAWFESFHKKGSTKFDHSGHIKAPFALLEGGYIGIYDVKGGGGWTQTSAQSSPASYRARAKVGSRRERRRTPRDQWMRSSV